MEKESHHDIDGLAVTLYEFRGEVYGIGLGPNCVFRDGEPHWLTSTGRGGTQEVVPRPTHLTEGERNTYRRAYQERLAGGGLWQERFGA